MFTSFRGLFALLLLSATVPFAVAQEPKKDLYGDPLPPGAIARIGTVRLRGFQQQQQLALSPNGKLLVAGSDHRPLKVWDASTGQLLREIPLPKDTRPPRPDPDCPRQLVARESESLAAFAFTPDSRQLNVLTQSGAIRTCDVTSGAWSDPLSRTALQESEGYSSGGWGRVSPDGTHFLYTTPSRVERAPITEMFAVGKNKLVAKFDSEKYGRLQQLSRDNRLILTIKRDGPLTVWDLKTDKAVATFTAPEGTFHGAAISPDGKYLTAICGPNKHLRPPWGCQVMICWDLATQKERFRIYDWQTQSVFYSPDGAWLVGFSSGGILVADSLTGKLIHWFPGYSGDGRFTAHTFSADGDRLITGGQDGSIIFWDLGTGTPTLDFDSPRGAVDVIAFSPDGKTLYAGGSGGAVGGLWNAETGKRKHRLDPQEWANPFVAAFPLPVMFCVRMCVMMFPDAGNPLAAVFTPDGEHVVVGCGSRGTTRDGNYSAQLWRVANGKLIREFPGHKESVREVVLSRDGKQLATWDRMTCKVRLWELDTGKLAREVEWVGRREVELDIGDGTTRKTYLDTHEAIFSYTTAGELIGVAAERGMGKGDTEAINLLTRKVLGKWKGGERAAPIAISPDGQLVAVCESQRVGKDRIIVRRVATGEVVCTLPLSRESVLFSPNSKTLAVSETTAGVGRILHLYDVETGKLLRTIRAHNAWITGVAFSADAKRLATGGDDSTVLVWDLTTKP